MQATISFLLKLKLKIPFTVTDEWNNSHYRVHYCKFILKMWGCFQLNRFICKVSDGGEMEGKV